MSKNLVGKTFWCDNEEYIVEEVLLFGHRCIARNLNYDTTEQFYCENVIEWIKREEDKIEKGIELQKELNKDKSDYSQKTNAELLEIISKLETIIEAKDKKESKYREEQQSLKEEVETWKERCLKAEGIISDMVNISKNVAL